MFPRYCVAALLACALGAACGGDDDDDDVVDDPDAATVLDAAAAAAIPANTTDCITNAAGCLESTTDTCAIELTAPIAGAAVDVRVDGTLNTGGLAFLDISAFAVSNGYQWSGYTAAVDRAGGQSSAHRSLHDDTTLTLESDSWTIMADADYALSIRTSFDTAASSGSIAIEATGAPTTPLSTSAMQPTTSDVLVIQLRNGEVCNLVVTIP